MITESRNSELVYRGGSYLSSVRDRRVTSRAGKELWFGRQETWFGGLGSAPERLLDFGQLFTFVSEKLDEIL